MTLYHLTVTLHVLAALLWLGGMFFLAAVGAPVLRELEPAVRAALFRRLGERFRAVGWICIAVLVVTGLMLLEFRGVLSWSVLSSPEFLASPFGHALGWKLGAVVFMLVLQAWHDFSLGPRAGRLVPGSEAALRLRRQAAWTARLVAVAGIVLVWAAVRLARGG